MPNDMGFGGFGGPILAIIGIWSVVGLGVYVWYLWALARLFPYLGLPAAHGWIPIWNQWRLIERGGLPGWTAVLGIIPGLQLVTYVMSVIAIHRINQEHEETTGMTVLGALLAPMWATLLGSRLQDRGYAADGGPAGFTQSTAKGLVEYGPDGQVYPLLPGTASAPQQPSFGMPPVPGPTAAPTPRPAATPLSPGGFPAPGSNQSASNPLSPPATQHPSPVTPARPAAAEVPGVPGADGVPGSTPSNPWGLGNTTEGNFQRLANEQPPSRDASFGGGFDSRPFSWPQPAPIPPVAQPADAKVSAPAPGTPASGEDPTASDVPEPAVETHVMDDERVPVPTPLAQPEPVLQPRPIDLPEPITLPELAADPGATDLLSSSVASEQVPVPVPVPEPEAAVSGPEPVLAVSAPEPAVSMLDDELDETIVVSRRARWVLELPDGQQLELASDDVVVGRKPVAVDGSDVLIVPDPTRTLSKTHARLRLSGDGWTVEDMHSTNGVFTVDTDGVHSELPPGSPAPATEHLVIGTLEVRLLSID